jgi:hypothetical protein
MLQVGARGKREKREWEKYNTVNGYRHNLKSYRLTYEFLYDRISDKNSEPCPVCLDKFWSSAGFSLKFKL